ncbi:MAG: hypothetical protein ACRC23_01900 [Aeromonas jandaei]
MKEKLKIIVVEGTDGTGKSTFAKELAEKYNLMYMHIDGNHPNTYQSYATMLCDLISDINKEGKYSGVVFDRAWYGELVYGPVYRSESRISPHEIQKLEYIISTILDLDFKKYLCVNTIANKLKVYKERGEEEASHDEKDMAHMAERFMVVMSDKFLQDTIITRRF